MKNCGFSHLSSNLASNRGDIFAGEETWCKTWLQTLRAMPPPPPHPPHMKSRQTFHDLRHLAGRLRTWLGRFSHVSNPSHLVHPSTPSGKMLLGIRANNILYSPLCYYATVLPDLPDFYRKVHVSSWFTGWFWHSLTFSLQTTWNPNLRTVPDSASAVVQRVVYIVNTELRVNWPPSFPFFRLVLSSLQVVLRLNGVIVVHQRVREYNP